MNQTAGLDRRNFLKSTGLALGAAGLSQAGHALASSPAEPAPDLASADWPAIQQQFPLQPDYIHMAGFLLTSHPKPVAEAINRYRQWLDANPANILLQKEDPLEHATLEAAADYINDSADNIALVESTTVGVATLYGGIAINADQQILTTDHDHYVTFTSLDMTVKRTGASLKRIALYDKPAEASVEQILARLKASITAKTRVLAVTWVHSGTGVKLPIAQMAEVVKEANRGRSEADRLLFCVDGVHGFGIENIDVQALGCDFFIAGTHKWMFGPRGTGILWGKKEAWAHVEPSIPSFHRDAFMMWMGYLPQQQLPGAIAMTPGGTHAFEHRWALAEAFKFHQAIGKQRVQQRIHALNSRLKQGLKAIPGLRLHTPVAAELSSGITAFEMDQHNILEVVNQLAERRIIATMSPYKHSYVRLAPGLINSNDDVDRCIEALQQLA